ncbi:hypothetical protein ACFQDG_02400 [Natronoarchaeum mannanilyticum]|uniref:Uncharacterized protein n=1 Tax=Natronoarchaeum mannanilyticum TaxID=926360 RepID=A0AAV3T5X3_9EURY
MARDTDRQKLSLFEPLVDHRDEGDDTAPDDPASDDDSAEGERRPDAVPYFRHR